MSRFRNGAVFATLLSALWVSGCATAPPKEETAELQLAAIQRWSACLQRHAGTMNTPMIEVSKLMNHDCEGYKRDIIALFPPHLSDQVDAMLVNSAHQHIDARLNQNRASAQSDDLVNAALR